MFPSCSTTSRGASPLVEAQNIPYVGPHHWLRPVGMFPAQYHLSTGIGHIYLGVPVPEEHPLFLNLTTHLRDYIDERKLSLTSTFITDCAVVNWGDAPKTCANKSS
eukprot:8318579-Pyramimonas_sp.AAC.1